jgi:tRNA threonylcarbamoyladenosine biosynthesis protein TsaB
VALATGKALTFALKKTLVGISTLDCLAAQQQQWQGPVCALLEAGRGELYAACYTFEMVVTGEKLVTYQLQRLGDYVLLSPEEIGVHVRKQASLQSLSRPWLMTGEVSEASRLILREKCLEQTYFVGATRSVRRASVLAMLGLQRVLAGEQDDPLLLEPFYLRRPSITKSVRKQPLFGSAIQQSGEHDTEREEGALRH